MFVVIEICFLLDYLMLKIFCIFGVVVLVGFFFYWSDVFWGRVWIFFLVVCLYGFVLVIEVGGVIGLCIDFCIVFVIWLELWGF